MEFLWGYDYVIVVRTIKLQDPASTLHKVHIKNIYAMSGSLELIKRNNVTLIMYWRYKHEGIECQSQISFITPTKTSLR